MMTALRSISPHNLPSSGSRRRLGRKRGRTCPSLALNLFARVSLWLQPLTRPLLQVSVDIFIGVVLHHWFKSMSMKCPVLIQILTVDSHMPYFFEILYKH